MTQQSYLTLELTDNESISFTPSLLKYIPGLERDYEDGELIVQEDEDFQLEWSLWNLMKEIIIQFDTTYGTAIGPDKVITLSKASLFDSVQLYDLYRMLRVAYHYDISLLIHLLLQKLVDRSLPLDVDRLTLMNPKLGRKPEKGLADTLSTPIEVINQSYSVLRELLMTAFTYYLDIYDLLQLIETRYLPEITSVLSSGDGHVAILTQGGLLIKGNNAYGELGFGMPQTPSNRWYISPVNHVISVWCGAHHTMILTSDRGLLACGSNEYGQAGVENRQLGRRLFEPAKVNIPQVLSVACGTWHTLALTVDGVYGFGRNNHGQLGSDRDLRIYIPVAIDLEETITAVACGDYYSLVLGDLGTVYHSGLSLDGIPVETRRFTKVILPEKAGKIISIHAGARHAIMINTEKEVFLWGSNEDGQLGLGNRTQWRGEVVKHPTLRNIVNAAACNTSSMFIDEKGDLYGCGDNSYNQLGLLGGSKSNTTVPVKIDIENVISVACGLTYTKILTCNGLFTTDKFEPDIIAIKKEEIVRIAERPICKKQRLASLHCHLCGHSDYKDLSLNKRNQRIVCSNVCLSMK